MRQMNLFFFGEEAILLQDALWFYGTHAVVVVLVGLVTLTVK